MQIDKKSIECMQEKDISKHEITNLDSNGNSCSESSPLEALPDLALERILSYCDDATTYRASLVSKKLNMFSNLYFKDKLKSFHPDFVKIFRRETRYTMLYFEQKKAFNHAVHRVMSLLYLPYIQERYEITPSQEIHDLLEGPTAYYYETL